MTDIIIITALAIVLGVIIGYQIGKASVKQPDTTSGTLRLDTQLLSKWENEKRTTKTSTRYVRMEYNNLNFTNDRVEEMEIKGYAVTDTDSARGIITMEKTINPEGAREGASSLVRHTEVAFWPATPKDESLPEGHC